MAAKTVVSKAGYVAVEMEQVFTGWITLTGMKGKPGGKVTIMASAVPFAGSDACAAATKAGRPYCDGKLPAGSSTGAPEYTMQHEYVFDNSGTGSFRPRFSYHEVHHLVITGLSEAPTAAQIVGHRVGNIAKLWSPAEDAGGGRARLSEFSCSNALLNKVYNTSMWTKANLVTGGCVDVLHLLLNHLVDFTRL